MTHADFIAWWALVLAILAIIFHVPLSMLAHHYLPRVENYAASHSRAKLVKRIAKLQRRLDQLNDPKYFEDLEWRFREHLFVIMYMFGTGFFVQAGILFLATGAVPANMFWWKPVPYLPLANQLPVATTVLFIVGVVVAGMNMYKSAPLRPSKRPKLKLDIQVQVHALQSKLAAFDAKSSSARIRNPHSD